MLSKMKSRFRLKSKHESRAATSKPRGAVAIVFGLMFANDVCYKLQCRQVLKASELRRTYWRIV